MLKTANIGIAKSEFVFVCWLLKCLLPVAVQLKNYDCSKEFQKRRGSSESEEPPGGLQSRAASSTDAARSRKTEGLAEKGNGSNP